MPFLKLQISAFTVIHHRSYLIIHPPPLQKLEKPTQKRIGLPTFILNLWKLENRLLGIVPIVACPPVKYRWKGKNQFSAFHRSSMTGLISVRGQKKKVRAVSDPLPLLLFFYRSETVKNPTQSEQVTITTIHLPQLTRNHGWSTYRRANRWIQGGILPLWQGRWWYVIIKETMFVCLSSGYLVVVSLLLLFVSFPSSLVVDVRWIVHRRQYFRYWSCLGLPSMSSDARSLTVLRRKTLLILCSMQCRLNSARYSTGYGSSGCGDFCWW